MMPAEFAIWDNSVRIRSNQVDQTGVAGHAPIAPGPNRDGFEFGEFVLLPWLHKHKTWHQALADLAANLESLQ